MKDIINKFRKALYAYDVKPLPFPAEEWQGALVFNAPRPLSGSATGIGDWHCGVHYAVVNPLSDFAEQDLKTNLGLDAVILVPAMVEQLVRLGESQIPEKYIANYRKLTDMDAKRDIALRYADEYKDLHNYDAIMEVIRCA